MTSTGRAVRLIVLLLLLALGVVMCTWLGEGPPPASNTELDEAMPALQAK
ncbi:MULTISPECIES: hypothetical protein [unclassified Synechococcus]|jgi:hypothetical protein|nr:hypothetical protein [Synechococcus sp. A10-1-5-1]UPM49413.1 hypothetical protein MY494_08680 [Synechococcus sp. A10-1-5-1]